MLGLGLAVCQAPGNLFRPVITNSGGSAEFPATGADGKTDEENGWGRLVPGDSSWRPLREPRTQVHWLQPVVEKRSDPKTLSLRRPFSGRVLCLHLLCEAAAGAAVSNS